MWVFCEKGVLRNFTKFTGKNLCQSIFFNKVAGLRHRCFPVNFVKFPRTPFLTEHLWWLLLTRIKVSRLEMFVTIYKDTRKVYSCYTKDLKSTVKKFHKNLKSSPNF